MKGLSKLLKQLTVSIPFTSMDDCISHIVPPIKKIAIDGNLYANKYAVSVGDIAVGFLKQSAYFLSRGILPVYVFDGKDSYPLEKKAVQANRARKNKTHLPYGVFEHLERLLTSVGIPVVYGPSEGDCLCAQLNIQGLVDACLTDDLDVLVRGGRRIIKKEDGYYRVSVYEHDKVLGVLQLESDTDMYNLVALLGCDYGRGLYSLSSQPMTALQNLQTHKNLENVLSGYSANQQDSDRINHTVEVLRETQETTVLWLQENLECVNQVIFNEDVGGDAFECIHNLCKTHGDVFPKLAHLPYDTIKTIRVKRPQIISLMIGDRHKCM